MTPDGYRRRRQRSSRACLLVAVSSCARRVCSVRSFIMIALTDATEIPIWRAICLCVLLVCGAVSSWLNLFNHIISANCARTTTARVLLKFPVSSILVSNFATRLMSIFLARVLLYNVLPSTLFFCKIELNVYLLENGIVMIFTKKRHN